MNAHEEKVKDAIGKAKGKGGKKLDRDAVAAGLDALKANAATAPDLASLQAAIASFDVEQFLDDCA